MLFKTAISATAAALETHQAVEAATLPSAPRDDIIDVEAPPPVGIRIATDTWHACNCSNNCSYKAGSSCKYYSGPSGNSKVDNGRDLECRLVDNRGLACISN